MQVEGRKMARLGPGEGHAVRMPGECLVTLRVGSDRTGGAYSCFEVEVGPGGGEPPHVQHREDECICVLEGRFEVLIEDERFAASDGSVIYVPKGTLHALENMGGGPGRLLAIHTPGGTHERFVEEAGEPATDEGAPPKPEGPPNSGSLSQVAAEHGIEMVPPFPAGTGAQETSDGAANPREVTRCPKKS